MITYPFPQQPSILPGKIATLFKDFEEIGVIADHILDLYLLAHAKKHTPSDLGSPYQYMRTVGELTTNDQAIRYTDLEKTFNRNYPLLRSTSALDFLSAFEARYRHKADDSGLNNGMVYERFFSKIVPTDRITIIDPPTCFINKLINDPTLSQTRIQFFLSNKRYVEILQTDDQFDRFAPRSYQAARCVCADKILFFGIGLSYEESKEVFVSLLQKISNICSPVLFSLLPTAFIDQHGEESLRSSIGKLFSIQLIALIPSQATNIAPRKRCMLVMRPGVGQFPKVILQNTKCEGCKTVTSLTPTKARNISCDYLMQSSATLYSLYQQAKSLSAPVSKRQKPAIYRFSRELSIGYSISQVGEKFRPKFTPYLPPTTRQLRENHEGHGSALCKAFSGKLYPSHDALIADIEHFYFNSTKIRTAINTLPRLFQDHACSLKTFCYLHQEQFLTDLRYDRKLMEELFLVPNLWDSKLCAMDIRTANTEEIKLILDDAAQAASMSDTRKRKFYKQIEVIYDWVGKVYPDIRTNPITPLFQDLLERPDTVHAMRDNMVRRSWTHAEEKRLLEILASDTTSPTLALAALIRFYTGISIREACALVWGDYQRIPRFGLHTLTIRRRFKGNSTIPVPLETKDLYRSIPVCQPLEVALSQYKSKIKGICSTEQLDTLPVISDPQAPDIPIRPKKLIAYERALLERLALPELHLYVPSEDDPVDVDINDYQGDWMRSNFRYHCQHDGHMDTDEVRYCLGMRPETTAAQHYNSALKETSQLRMCCAINRWAAIHNLSDTVSSDIHTLRVKEAPRTISSLPSLQPTEFLLDIHTSKIAPDATLDLSIFARYGMSIAIEEIAQKGVKL